MYKILRDTKYSTRPQKQTKWSVVVGDNPVYNTKIKLTSNHPMSEFSRATPNGDNARRVNSAGKQMKIHVPCAATRYPQFSRPALYARPWLYICTYLFLLLFITRNQHLCAKLREVVWSFQSAPHTFCWVNPSVWCDKSVRMLCCVVFEMRNTKSARRVNPEVNKNAQVL